MDNISFASALAQVASEGSGENFRSVIRGFCREMILESLSGSGTLADSGKWVIIGGVQKIRRPVHS